MINQYEKEKDSTGFTCVGFYTDFCWIISVSCSRIIASNWLFYFCQITQLLVADINVFILWSVMLDIVLYFI